MIENFTLILSVLFLAFFLISLFFYLYFYSRLAFYKADAIPENTSELPVTVIVCAQNENENLKNFLPSILEQDYPEFEVIVVDDGSWDESRYTLQNLQMQYASLRVIELSEHVKNKQGKKFALMMGIKGAKYDHLLLTDADCQPASTQWLKLMQSQFSDEKTIVLGYSPYFKKKSLLNVFIRFETLITASNYFSFALAGIPYMGVGRNLSYHKRLFFETKGFSSHIHLMSGDDDLFINKVARKGNTAIMIAPDSFTFSEPKISFNEYFRQKMRHLSVGKYYKKIHKSYLGLHAVSTILFYILFVVLIGFHFMLQWVLGVFVFRMLIQWIILGRISKRLGSSELGVISPLYDIFYHLYLVFINVSGLFYKQKTWK